MEGVEGAGCIYLVTSRAGQGAKGALDSAGGRVDVGLEGGGVLVRHVDVYVVEFCWSLGRFKNEGCFLWSGCSLWWRGTLAGVLYQFLGDC